MFTACDLYLGFKNYCRGCCCTHKKIEMLPNKNIPHQSDMNQAILSDPQNSRDESTI